MSLEELISTYGYTAIAIGTFLEGETILLLGGFAAHRGYLELIWVIGIAFLATFLNCQLLFYFGLTKGTSILEKRPNLKRKSEKIIALLNKHQTLLILGFRFLYGLRTATPLLLGASNVPSFRFLILNLLGALIWSIAFGVMGYMFGHTIELIIGDIEYYEIWLFLGLVIMGISIWCIYFFNKKKSIS